MKKVSKSIKKQKPPHLQRPAAQQRVPLVARLLPEAQHTQRLRALQLQLKVLVPGRVPRAHAHLGGQGRVEDE